MWGNESRAREISTRESASDGRTDGGDVGDEVYDGSGASAGVRGERDGASGE